MTREISVKVTPSAELLRDIVITAVESGIGYWSVATRYKWDGLPFPEVRIEPNNDSDDFPNNDGVGEGGVTLTPEHILVGMEKLLAGTPLAPTAKQNLIKALIDDDAAYLDADDADVIVQLGVLGDIVYG